MRQPSSDLSACAIRVIGSLLSAISVTIIVHEASRQKLFRGRPTNNYAWQRAHLLIGGRLHFRWREGHGIYVSLDQIRKFDVRGGSRCHSSRFLFHKGTRFGLGRHTDRSTPYAAATSIMVRDIDARVQSSRHTVAKRHVRRCSRTVRQRYRPPVVCALLQRQKVGTKRPLTRKKFRLLASFLIARVASEHKMTPADYRAKFGTAAVLPNDRLKLFGQAIGFGEGCRNRSEARITEEDASQAQSEGLEKSH